MIAPAVWLWVLEMHLLGPPILTETFANERCELTQRQFRVLSPVEDVRGLNAIFEPDQAVGAVHEPHRRRLLMQRKELDKGAESDTEGRGGYGGISPKS